MCRCCARDVTVEGAVNSRSCRWTRRTSKHLPMQPFLPCVPPRCLPPSLVLTTECQQREPGSSQPGERPQCTCAWAPAPAGWVRTRPPWARPSAPYRGGGGGASALGAPARPDGLACGAATAKGRSKAEGRTRFLAQAPLS